MSNKKKGFHPVENDGGGESLADDATDAPSGKRRRKVYSKDDIGNAERLLDAYGEDMRWNQGLGEWAIWNGDRWVFDAHEAMRRAKRIPREIVNRGMEMLQYAASADDEKKANALIKWGEATGNMARLDAMLRAARSEVGVSIPDEGFDSDPEILNCPNGTLVLGARGAEFRELRKSDMCTRVVGCEYREEARSPMWDDFLDTFLPDFELRKWAQKLAGYSMFGGNPGRKIVVVWGPTSSGKSTFAELVREAMGGYAGGFNLSMLRDNQDERARPDLVRAMTQRAVFASETSSAWKLHADQIKRITGQDVIVARLPHVGVPIERVPAFTPWVVTNGVPTIEGADTALYRRLATVLFPKSISEDREKLGFTRALVRSGQLPGVLAWLVEGWNLYAAEGLGGAPAKIVEAQMRMQDQFSDLDVFLSECCDRGGSYREVPSDLFQAYESWCEANGSGYRDRLSQTMFGRQLTGRGIPCKHIKVDGKPVRRRLGVRLKPRGEGASV